MPKRTLLQTLRRWTDKIAPGGDWSDGGDAGVWALSLSPARSFVSVYFGFRPEELAAVVRDAEEAPGLREARDALAARVAELEADMSAALKGAE